MYFDTGAGNGLMMGNQSVRSPGHTLAVLRKEKYHAQQVPLIPAKDRGDLSPMFFSAFSPIDFALGTIRELLQPKRPH